MENNKKVTLSQLETALTRAKEAAPGAAPVDDTATDAEVAEMLDRVFGTEDKEPGGEEPGGEEPGGEE